MILVEVHLEFPADMTILAAHEISEHACARIMQIDDILQVTTHFDPVTDTPGDMDHEEINNRK